VPPTFLLFLALIIGVPIAVVGLATCGILFLIPGARPLAKTIFSLGVGGAAGAAAGLILAIPVVLAALLVDTAYMHYHGGGDTIDSVPIIILTILSVLVTPAITAGGGAIIGSGVGIGVANGLSIAQAISRSRILTYLARALRLQAGK
jgi:hypothetical protein